MSLILVRPRQAVTLPQLTAGQPTLVVLTRHRDCPMCELHVRRVARSRPQLGRVVVVSFEPPNKLIDLMQSLPFAIVLVSDQRRELYSLVGAEKMQDTRFLLHPKILWANAGRLLRRKPLRRDHADIMQLGADIILDEHGNVAWKRVPTSPDDRPRVSELVKQMDLVRSHRDA